MKIAFVLGTRPEIIKCYSLIAACVRHQMPHVVIHTGQHYDPMMDAQFFEELELPQPHHRLQLAGKGPAEQLGHMVAGVAEVLAAESPDVVLVQGDTNAVLAGALAANKLGIKIGHIEAGLRSFDRAMPEEHNRVMTDHIADYLFCPTEAQVIQLAHEAVTEGVSVTGNTVVDAVLQNIEAARARSTALQTLGVASGEFFLLTCHRPSNTDSHENFHAILSSLHKLATEEGRVVIFPAHPRLKARLSEIEQYPTIRVIDPLGYRDLLLMQEAAAMIFSDSGGIQEESCILERKCVVLRTNTERPEPIEVGGAVLVPEISETAIVSAYHELMKRDVRWRNPFGDGKTYAHILKALGCPIE